MELVRHALEAEDTVEGEGQLPLKFGLNIADQTVSATLKGCPNTQLKYTNISYRLWST
jgi:hypothetical protein